ncbi:PREDICTED: translation initiation factor IF-2-like [Capra hircus]|uniref:translation initiation factor IF-2-like n=1 Tax=Capra hircus TaxID=9925 RepID=UPI0008462FC3|nr:PREDICTED: translation initiation factor IF-2-like [Capra hircus]
MVAAPRGRRREGIWRRGPLPPPRAGCAQRTEIAAPAPPRLPAPRSPRPRPPAAGGGRREGPAEGLADPSRRPCRRRGPITGLHTPADGELTTSQGTAPAYDSPWYSGSLLARHSRGDQRVSGIPETEAAIVGQATQRTSHAAHPKAGQDMKSSSLSHQAFCLPHPTLRTSRPVSSSYTQRN